MFRYSRAMISTSIAEEALSPVKRGRFDVKLKALRSSCEVLIVPVRSYVPCMPSVVY